jgi:hypothetical protein
VAPSSDGASPVVFGAIVASLAALGAVLYFLATRM